MITRMELKQMGFKKPTDSSNEWTWGTYTYDTRRDSKLEYRPILRYLEVEHVVKTNISSNNGHFEIVKKVSSGRDLEEVMNMASFVLSGR
jgi:hypothetical protein